MNRPAGRLDRTDARVAWLLMAPAFLVMIVVAIVPIGMTAWEALHVHDLRLPWLGRPFSGLDNFVEAAQDARFRGAVVHTLGFAIVSVAFELVLGVAFALLMHSVTRGRGPIRAMVLLPWAVPTVVAALVWRFLFESQGGLVSTTLRDAGVVAASFDWFVHPWAAWVPIVVADIWKTTPFVALLLLAGLQAIDPSLDEAARVDGAGAARRLFTITLPLLAPAVVVAAAFRMLDALRIFDLAYVLTGGGPGTATEQLSLYAFATVMQRLRFGYGAALSISVFLLTFAFALVWVRALGRSLVEKEPA